MKNFHKSAFLAKKVELLLLLLLISGCSLTVGTTHSSSGGQSAYHVVRRGENLFRISEYYYGYERTRDIHTGVERIKRANNMTAEQLSVGQRLLIPGTSRQQPSRALLPPQQVPPSITPDPGRPAPPVTPDIQRTASIITDHAFIWPVNGRVIGRFGELGNQGIDIVAEQGKDVLASDSGRVVFAGVTQKHRDTVIIEHANNIFTVYGNDIDVIAQQGKEVKKGDVIARIKSGTHRIRYLHFEIRMEDTAVNPLLYLPPQENNER